MHGLIERFYKGELGGHQLLHNYLAEFRKNVPEPAPSYQIFKHYFTDGVNYLRDFKPLPFRMIDVEKQINMEIDGVPFTGWIDFLGEDDDGLVIIDNKSRLLKPRSKREKPTKSDVELDEYLRQLYLYAIAIQKEYGRRPEKLGFNCFRKEEPLIIERYTTVREEEAKQWFFENISYIEREREYKPKMDFFKCKHLCDMRDHCEFFEMTWG